MKCAIGFFCNAAWVIAICLLFGCRGQRVVCREYKTLKDSTQKIQSAATLVKNETSDMQSDMQFVEVEFYPPSVSDTNDPSAHPAVRKITAKSKIRRESATRTMDSVISVRTETQLHDESEEKGTEKTKPPLFGWRHLVYLILIAGVAYLIFRYKNIFRRS